jgi:hypothetical protein
VQKLHGSIETIWVCENGSMRRSREREMMEPHGLRRKRGARAQKLAVGSRIHVRRACAGSVTLRVGCRAEPVVRGSRPFGLVFPEPQPQWRPERCGGRRGSGLSGGATTPTCVVSEMDSFGWFWFVAAGPHRSETARPPVDRVRASRAHALTISATSARPFPNSNCDL